MRPRKLQPLMRQIRFIKLAPSPAWAARALGNQIQGFAPTTGPIAGWKVVGLADLTNDGHPDAIIQDTDGSVGVWYLGGAQGNQIQGFALIAGPSTWMVKGAVDMDGDGYPDLTIR